MVLKEPLICEGLRTRPTQLFLMQFMWQYAFGIYLLKKDLARGFFIVNSFSILGSF